MQIRLFAVLNVIIVAATSGFARAQGQTSAGSNRVISPAVVAYWQQHDTGDGTGRLDLLVLWRGTPGWFTRGNGTSGSGRTSGGFGQWHAAHAMTYGDISLVIELQSSSKDFDPATTIVKILDRDIPLRDTNVVLIDGVDSGKATIIRTLRVEPQFVGSDPVAAVVKRSPELFEFLQCDATLPDPQMQSMMTFLCGQMRP